MSKTKETVTKKFVPRYYSPPPDYLEGCAPEQALCYDFIIECIEAGWRVYPEYPNSSFDMLLVAEEGHITEGVAVGTQIGIQAKMSLNSKLVGQLVRSVSHLRWPGPDYVVALIPGKPRTPAEKNMEDILRSAGHGLMYVYSHFESHEPERHLRRKNFLNTAHFGTRRTFRKRIELPEINIWTEPGVASPTPLTRWKLMSVKFCMMLEKTDGVTRRQFKEMKPNMNIQLWLDEEWIIPSGRKDGRSQIYILNPDSKGRPDRLHANIRTELERVSNEAKQEDNKEAGSSGQDSLREG